MDAFSTYYQIYVDRVINKGKDIKRELDNRQKADELKFISIGDVRGDTSAYWINDRVAHLVDINSVEVAERVMDKINLIKSHIDKVEVFVTDLERVNTDAVWMVREFTEALLGNRSVQRNQIFESIDNESDGAVLVVNNLAYSFIYAGQNSNPKALRKVIQEANADARFYIDESIEGFSDIVKFIDPSRITIICRGDEREHLKSRYKIARREEF